MATKKEALEKRIEALRAKLGEEVAKEKKALRRADARHKIRVGALLIGDSSDAAQKLLDMYHKVIAREDAEREAKAKAKEKAGKKEPAVK